MKEEELDKWWSHLTIVKKENLSQEQYPSCTAWWISLDKAHKERVYELAGGRDAHGHHRWKKCNGTFTD